MPTRSEQFSRNTLAGPAGQGFSKFENTWMKDGVIYKTDPETGELVPLSDIPGAWDPGKWYKDMASNLRTITDLLPGYSAAINAQILPQELAQLQASQATSGPYAQLMTELYAKYGPQLNQIGSDIARQNQLNQAAADLEVWNTSGKALAESIDPEYYATRELTSSRLADLMNNINLGSGLSASELREIEQGLAREGDVRGTYGAPNQTETIANAMQYGAAGRARQVENQNQLAKAVAASASFLPSSRTGSDMFQMFTGKSGGQNSGESKFLGINTPNVDEVTALTSPTIATAGADMAQRNDIQANQKDWLDQFVQFTQGLSNIGKAAGGFAGMCWVAREVYGAENPRWMEFRHWLLTSAPKKLLRIYWLKGERFAKKIKNKPKIKQAVRAWMDTKLGYNN